MNCPHCNKSIRWYDNIPLVSFTILLGKCRFCKGRVSLRYPFVELLCGCMFLFLFNKDCLKNLFLLLKQFFKQSLKQKDRIFLNLSSYNTIISYIFAFVKENLAALLTF